MSRYNITRKVVLFWCLFVGIGALYGSILMFIDPSGKLLMMDNILKYFEVLPFSHILFKNYIFSGIALLIVNGLTNLIAAILLIKKDEKGIILGTVFGFTLMLWIMIQFIILPLNILSISFFVIGFIQVIMGYMCYVFYLQESFKIEDIYQNIGTNNKILVYFSRLGYTKKIALECANEVGAEVLEIKPLEKTNGTVGFWWCGRFGLIKKGMPIEEIDKDLTKYEEVIICSPIWVFDVSAPIREFCNKYSGKLNNVSYVLVHFMNSSFKNIFDEMDTILKIKRISSKSICMRFGYVRGIKYDRNKKCY